MKIGIISQSPAWTTGFGVTCNKIAFSLSKLGHSVTCFCIGGYHHHIIDTDNGTYPFKIWKPEKEKDDFLGESTRFLKEVNPDAIFINFDIEATAFFVKGIRMLNWQKIIVAHIVMDGFPVHEDVLECIKELKGIIVPTKTSKKYLLSKGIKPIYYAPHGVDYSEFIPLDKRKIKSTLAFKSIAKQQFIIGVFAKNEERKQVPKIFLALHHLIYKLKEKNILLYVHSQSKPIWNRGYDLRSLATSLGLNKYVIFTDEDFQQDIGIDKNISQNSNRLGYIERINMCDVIVNVPFSGGFELSNIEAQACGVPVITINDNGNIKEVVGDSALLIEPKIKNIWRNGAVIYLVDEVELATKILQVKNDSVLQKTLRRNGFENIKKYSWSALEKAVKKLITQISSSIPVF